MARKKRRKKEERNHRAKIESHALFHRAVITTRNNVFIASVIV